MTDEPMTLVDRLLNPSWCHSEAPFESPQLEALQTVSDMREGADEIERLQRRVKVLEMVIMEELPPIFCDCDANRMIVVGIREAALSPAECNATPSAPDASIPAHQPHE